MDRCRRRVLAASVLLGVAGGAYRAGQRDEVVTRTAGDGDVVRVVDGHGWGPGPGLFLFPLAVVAVILLVRGGGSGGWHRPYGPPEEAFREWHRRAHAEQGPTPAGAASSSGPPER